MLRLTAFLLPVDDVEVDFSWVANAAVSIRRDLHEEHVLEGDCDRKKRFTLDKESF